MHLWCDEQQWSFSPSAAVTPWRLGRRPPWGPGGLRPGSPRWVTRTFYPNFRSDNATLAATEFIGMPLPWMNAHPFGRCAVPQVLALYPGAECTGFVHFEQQATTIPLWNKTAFCADPKRPRDVCEAPMLDLNHGHHVSRLLPYLSFNQFRSERTPGTIETIRIADAKLSVEITPQFGGKVRLPPPARSPVAESFLRVGHSTAVSGCGMRG